MMKQSKKDNTRILRTRIEYQIEKALEKVGLGFDYLQLDALDVSEEQEKAYTKSCDIFRYMLQLLAVGISDEIESILVKESREKLDLLSPFCKKEKGTVQVLTYKGLKKIVKSQLSFDYKGEIKKKKLKRLIDEATKGIHESLTLEILKSLGEQTIALV